MLCRKNSLSTTVASKRKSEMTTIKKNTRKGDPMVVEEEKVNTADVKKNAR